MIHKVFLFLTALVVVLTIVVAKAFGAPPVEPKGYSIAEIIVTDAEAYKQYVAAVSPIVAHFEGKYLVRAGAIVPLEGEAPTGRFVVIEFPSLAIAKALKLLRNIARSCLFGTRLRRVGYSWSGVRHNPDLPGVKRLRSDSASNVGRRNAMSEVKALRGEEGMKKIGELIKDVRICMMTTAAGDGSFDSRPMATQKTDFDGTVWFLTRHESGKVEEIEQDAHVSLVYADPSNQTYVSAKGRASISRDKAKIHELWNPMYKAWFPAGENDPQIAVLKVDVTEAQYWEASSSKLVFGLKYLAAAVTGGEVSVGESGKVMV